MSAILLGRLIGWLSRISGHGGSSLPGLVALRLQSNVLRDLSLRLRKGTVVITGTNGKTTTAAMARRILTENHWHLVSNHNGANLLAGLTTAFMRDRQHLIPRADLALLEVDEATMPRAAVALSPQVIVVTNVFRDQLDRYGELATTLRFIQRGIDALSAGGTIVLNADDPQVAYLGIGRSNVVYFGAEPTGSASTSAYDASDSDRCPRCGERLQYRRRFYAHIGDYRCPSCQYERPTPSVTVTPTGDGRALMSGEFGEISVTMPLPGLYNLYNAAAATAISSVLGIPAASIPLALVDMPAAFGRMESVVIDSDTKLWIALVKNPVGFNQVIETMTQTTRRTHALLVINDRYADGRDVSWLWDVDFERPSLGESIGHWWISGVRAWDMAVRLKYAGIAESTIVVIPAVQDALAAAIEGSRGSILYVLPTYTALLEVRDLLTHQGLVRHFREG